MCYSNINVTIEVADLKEMEYINTISVDKNELSDIGIFTSWCFIGSKSENGIKENILNQRKKIDAVLRIKKAESDFDKIIRKFVIDVNDYDVLETDGLLCLNISKNFNIESIPLPELKTGVYFIDIVIKKIMDDDDVSDKPYQLQSRFILNVNSKPNNH